MKLSVPLRIYLILLFSGIATLHINWAFNIFLTRIYGEDGINLAVLYFNYFIFAPILLFILALILTKKYIKFSTAQYKSLYMGSIVAFGYLIAQIFYDFVYTGTFSIFNISPIEMVSPLLGAYLGKTKAN